MSMSRKQNVNPDLRRLKMRREQLQRRIAVLNNRIEQIRGGTHK
jgi:hypothetical protein